MKISKQSILITMSLILMLTFSLLTGCTTTQGEAAMSDASAGSVRAPTENVNAFWDDQDWGDMSKAEQDLWAFVGYTETVWIGDAKNPPEEDMYWKQLAPEKREALEKLGYTKSFWNNGDPK